MNGSTSKRRYVREPPLFQQVATILCVLFVVIRCVIAKPFGLVADLRDGKKPVDETIAPTFAGLV